jgi:hypothetical protein
MCQANRLTSLILTPHSRMIRHSPVWRIRKAPNFERPDREQNSWGRLAAQLGFLRAKFARIPVLQWIVLLAYRAPEAQRLSNRSASPFNTTGERTPFSEALPLLLIFSTLPCLVAIVQIGWERRLLDLTRER